MYFIVYAKDKPGHTQLRIETRPDHVTWLKKSPVPVAGPLLAADNETMIVEADSRADVEALLPNDPYAIVDLFESVEIHPWKWAIGSPAA